MYDRTLIFCKSIFDKITFVKAQGASVSASLVDFFVTIVLVEVVGKWYMAATITGTICGGITNFLLGRSWVFQASAKNMGAQIRRYFFVWNGNLLLNAGGVFAMTHYWKVNYLISKIVVAILVGFFYNYVLQKKYVFREEQ